MKPRPGLKDELAASVRKVDPYTNRKLIEEQRGGPQPRDPEEAGREPAAAGLPTEPLVKVRGWAQDQALQLSSSRCPMNLNETHSQKLLRESSLNRLRIPRSQRPAMSSEEFYRQMERSTGMRMIPIDFVPRQLAGIEDAADREGFLFRDLIPDAQGGVEHDVTFDAATVTVLKFTKPDRSTYTVDFKFGTPA